MVNIKDLKLKKVVAGEYHITLNGEYVGYIYKMHNGLWGATDTQSLNCTQTAIRRSDCLAYWLDKYNEELSQIAAAKEIVDIARAQDAADEQKEELQAAIDEKIQKADDQNDRSGYMIGHTRYNLKGSKLLDFIEFMHIESYERVIDFISFDKLCEEYAADDPESSADSHSDNFGDCWGDYKRAWQKANADHDRLCSCCQTQDLNSFGTERVEEKDGRGQIITVRSFNCSKCGGSGIKPAPLKFIGKMITVSMDDSFTCKGCGTLEKKHSTSEQSGLCISCEADSVEDDSDPFSDPDFLHMLTDGIEEDEIDEHIERPDVRETKRITLTDPDLDPVFRSTLFAGDEEIDSMEFESKDLQAAEGYAKEKFKNAYPQIMSRKDFRIVVREK